jgi:hypothetical protein
MFDLGTSGSKKMLNGSLDLFVGRFVREVDGDWQGCLNQGFFVCRLFSGNGRPRVFTFAPVIGFE